MALYRPTVLGVGLVAAADVNANLTGIRAGVNSIEQTEIPDDAAISNDKLVLSRSSTCIAAGRVSNALGSIFDGDMIEAQEMFVGGRLTGLIASIETPSIFLRVTRVRRNPDGTTTVTNAPDIEVTSATLTLYTLNLAYRIGDTIRIQEFATGFVGAGVGELRYDLRARPRHV